MLRGNLADGGSPSGEDQLRTAEYVRLVLLLLLAGIAVLTGAYFVLAYARGLAAIPQQFLLSVIVNLIPVLIIAAVSLTVLRHILRLQRDADAAGLRKAITSDLLEALKDGTQPGLAEVKEALSRELRDALVDSAPIRQFNEPPTSIKIPNLDSTRRAIIADIIHAMSVALIFPRPRSGLFIRTFCHLPDRGNRTLRPVCMWSSERETSDFDAIIPFDGPEAEPFVIAQAFRRNEIVKLNLPENHIGMYPDRLKGKILPELRGVVAAPISSYEPGDDVGPLGTISIDSTASLEDLGFQDETVRDVLIWGSRAVRRVLLMGKAHMG